MISKQEFSQVALIAMRDKLSETLPRMAAFKNLIQRAVVNVASPQEIMDVRDCRINQGLIDKMVRIASREWRKSGGDDILLYCAAMAVATIVKEFDWGTRYLVGDGLYEMAMRIYRA